MPETTAARPSAEPGRADRPIDLLIVDEADDPFGHAFSSFATARGVAVDRCRLPVAARRTTLDIAGCEVTVDPAPSVLVRPARPPLPDATEDERFAWTECYSTFWSAAALSPRPVVNRPNEWGGVSRSVLSAVVTERRAGRVPVLRENFWNDRPPPDPDRWFHQDLGSFAVSDSPAGITFGRSRERTATQGWEQVVVVGSAGFRVTTADIGPRDVEAQSVAAVAALGLQFATVSWAIPAGDGPAVLARVNPFPGLEECRPVLREVFTTLLELLLP
ncbi:hypothetical protein GCM10010172_66730 [Paractinoplanes ferrugineus]|uniref:ATP-grasp domain-containing protein n=1 Tax=Paractinoplanes ferrugineus TaxID=113564 RepID=A0A919J1R4_9ACTN|nr:hypothetical protein [Actinoplanes ferrugineus]GIE13166.1 hypothetical protein Afe05nite_50060 [Actinoplanes ferrugineus]